MESLSIVRCTKPHPVGEAKSFELVATSGEGEKQKSISVRGVMWGAWGECLLTRGSIIQIKKEK